MGALYCRRKEASERELLSRSDLEEEAPARWIEWGAGSGWLVLQFDEGILDRG